jgi:Ca-activated chloride channel family protein
MKELVIIFLFLLQGTLLFAQQGKRYIKKGNELYRQQNYTEAEASYRKSVTPKNKNIEGNFNLGDALYKQKKFAEAAEQFSKIAGTAGNDKAVTAQAYHNLGNSFVNAKKLEEGIAAYKKALLNNPKDEETRYNLAYAQEMLKKQQQNKDKNKDKNNKDNKKDQNKDKKDQDKKDQDKKDQNKDKDQQNKDQNKKDQKEGQQPQPNKLSKEDAERMLDALNNNEKETQDKLKNKKFKGEKARVAKDW